MVKNGSPLKAHLATLPDPSAMVIPLDFPFRLLVVSLAVSRIWAVPLLRRPLAAPFDTLRAGPGAAFQVGLLTRPRSGPFPTSYLVAMHDCGLISKSILLCTVLFALFFLSAQPVYTAQILTPDDIIKLKAAGVSDEVILELIKKGKEAEKSEKKVKEQPLAIPINESTELSERILPLLEGLNQESKEPAVRNILRRLRDKEGGVIIENRTTGVTFQITSKGGYATVRDMTEVLPPRRGDVRPRGPAVGDDIFMKTGIFIDFEVIVNEKGKLFIVHCSGIAPARARCDVAEFE